MRSGVSPERTSTSSAPSSAARAERTASPVPSGRSWTATSSPSKLAALSGDETTTSGSAPSGRAASTTQSTIRRPSSGCRCFGAAERIRVPSPPAITTAARSRRHHGITMAGAPGFEPGITGPKPVALPLGHAPEHGRAVYPAPSGENELFEASPAVEQEGRERQRCERHDRDRGEHDDRTRKDRNEHHDELRDRRRSRSRRARPALSCSRPQPT